LNLVSESIASTAFPLLYLQTEEKNITLFSLLQHREKRKKIPLPSLSINRFPLFQLKKHNSLNRPSALFPRVMYQFSCFFKWFWGCWKNGGRWRKFWILMIESKLLFLYNSGLKLFFFIRFFLFVIAGLVFSVYRSSS